MLIKIGSEIRRVRKERRLSQADLGKALGMSRATISLLESGTITELGIRKFIRILGHLGLEMSVRPSGAPPTLEELRCEEQER